MPRLVRRVLTHSASGLLSVALLLTFVFGLATLPPITVYRTPDSSIGYRLEMNGPQWAANIQTFFLNWKEEADDANPPQKRAAEAVWTGLKWSLALVGSALGLALLLGFLKGMRDFHQLRRRGLAIGPLVTGALQGLPEFWVVLLIQYAASLVWRLWDFSPFPVHFDPQRPIASMVYPTLALCLIPLGAMARVTCAAMSDVYEKEYIRTARAKGLREYKVIYKHAFRNAAVQMLDGLVSVIAVMFANLLVVEYLFNYPGLTPLLRNAVDLTVGIGIQSQMLGRVREHGDMFVLFFSGIALGLVFACLYWVVMLLRQFADPRLKGGESV